MDASVEQDCRRLTARGQATRARIVEAAAELMFRQGVAGTSIPDVLCAAGVSASQLYHYFDDKQDLVRAVIERQSASVLAGQYRFPLDTMESLREWRDAIVEAQDNRRCEGGCVIGSLAGELADSDEGARLAIAAGYAQWERQIRDGLAAMRDRGTLRAEADVESLAVLLLTALQGGLLLTQVRRETTALRVALDAAIAQVEAQTQSG
ncbi:MAG: TetR family transcriptional regulator C-terminal domain-containing protein [Sporichthyaceae bacterium]